MANERIDLELGVDDQASRKLEDVADLVDDLGDGKLEVEVDADTREAETRLERFERELDSLTNDSGRELRIEFRQQVLEGNIRSALRQLERLDDPVEIDIKQGELEDAQQELKELADLADRKYDVELDIDPKRNARRAADDVDAMRVNAEGLQSGIGPLRGFTDELGGSAGAAGTTAAALIDAGEAVEIFGGQLGASEALLGKISLGIGAAGLAAGGLALAWNRAGKAARESEALRVERVEAYNEALDDTESTLDAITETLRDAGSIEIDFGGAGNLDITPILNRLGVGVREFSQLVDGGKDRVGRWAESMRRAGVDGEYIKAVTIAATQEIDRFAEASKGAAESQAFLAGEDIGEYVDYIGDATKEWEDAKQATDDAGAAALYTKRQTDDVADSAGDVGDAYAEVRARVDEVSDAVDVLDTFISGIDSERATIRLRQDFERARAAIEEGTQSVDEQRLTVLDLIDSTATYAAEVLGIPEERVTSVFTAADPQSVADVEEIIRQLTADRVLRIRAQLTGNLGGGAQTVPGNNIPTDLAPGQGPAIPDNPVVTNTYILSNADARQIAADQTRWARYNGHAVR